MRVSVLTMSKEGLFCLVLVSCLLFKVFHNSYGQPSIPVVEPFLVSFRASLTCDCVIGLVRGEFSGAFSFGAAGTWFRAFSICVLCSSSDLSLMPSLCSPL